MEVDLLQKADAVIVMWVKNDKEKRSMIATPRQVTASSQFEPARWTFVVFWDDKAKTQDEDVGVTSDEDENAPARNGDGGDPPAPFPPSSRPRHYSDPDLPMDRRVPEPDI